MLFNYRAIDKDGHEREGTVEALSRDAAISLLQQRNLVISSIEEIKKNSIFSNIRIPFFKSVSEHEVVLLSRQISTLFEAQVSALRIFRLLAAEVDNKYLANILTVVADDVQGGSPISKALSRHPVAFSTLYVNMVRVGEEAGKLPETFTFLADYLDRSHEVVSKAQHALVYPAFVIAAFVAVMVLMLTMVIPRIGGILADSGQELPVYTQVVLAVSGFLVNYGIFILIALAVGGFFLLRALRTEAGKLLFDGFKLSIPYIGNLYQKLYLTRIADNFSTMLLAGVPIVEAVDITGTVVDNPTYERILSNASADIRGGKAMSEALGQYDEIPDIMIAMIRVGEETGELGNILIALSKYYRREVVQAVDTLLGLIEPAMIVLLGVGVGLLLAAVMVPIYNMAGGIG